MAAGKELSDANPSGTNMGQSITDKIAFYGVASPVVQRASAVQVAVSASAGVTGAVGFTTTQAAAILATLNEIVATLTGLGLWKGGA